MVRGGDGRFPVRPVTGAGELERRRARAAPSRPFSTSRRLSCGSCARTGPRRRCRRLTSGLATRFIVPAGERIALDGRVVAGASAVNQAPITGESVPVEKEPGAEVFAGTINGDGTLTVEATKAAEDTMLARIIHMVEDAHARRAPSEQWVERFARVYTPSVMALALLVFLAPPLLSAEHGRIGSIARSSCS